MLTYLTIYKLFDNNQLILNIWWATLSNKQNKMKKYFSVCFCLQWIVCTYVKKSKKRGNFMQRHNPTTVQHNNVELCEFFFHLRHFPTTNSCSPSPQITTLVYPFRCSYCVQRKCKTFNGCRTKAAACVQNETVAGAQQRCLHYY